MNNRQIYLHTEINNREWIGIFKFGLIISEPKGDYPLTDTDILLFLFT